MDRSQKSREEKMEEARQKLKLFQETNKTGFKEDGTYRGILSVTSGLDRPTKPLKSISTSEMICNRIANKLKYEQEQIAYGNPDAPRAGGKDQLVDEGGMSGHPDGQRVLVGGHEHGFIAAVTAAFRDHYPLSLKPQHFWLMITQAVAVHVSKISFRKWH